MTAPTIDLVLGTLLEISKDPLAKRIARSERVQRALRQLGLTPDPPPDDFDAIYVHALVEYGWNKPEPVLNLWREEQIRDAFRKSFHRNDPAILIEEVDQLLLVNEETAILGQIDYDLRLEIEEFVQAFHRIIDRVRTPQEIRQENLLREIRHDLTATSDQLQTLVELSKTPQALPLNPLPEHLIYTFPRQRTSQPTMSNEAPTPPPYATLSPLSLIQERLRQRQRSSASSVSVVPASPSSSELRFSTNG
jgi:hypothetical protein